MNYSIGSYTAKEASQLDEQTAQGPTFELYIRGRINSEISEPFSADVYICFAILDHAAAAESRSSRTLAVPSLQTVT